LNENQSGFRKGYSTIENIFVLYAFFEFFKLKKKMLFVTFVDFEKALIRYGGMVYGVSYF
jgi:hypothetical protein